MMDYLVICIGQLVLMLITLFCLYREKYCLFTNRVNVSTQNIFKFGHFMEIFAARVARKRSSSSTSSVQSTVQIRKITPPSSTTPPLLRRLSEVSTDSGQSFDSSKKQEEYIIEFLDLLQSQTGHVLAVDRKLAVKMVEIALNAETESSERFAETKSSVSEKLDEIMEQLVELNQRLSNLEAKFVSLDGNNNQIIEND